MRFTWVLFWIFCTVKGFGAGKYHFDYTDNCSKAYIKYLSLQPDAGNQFIKKELISDPYNLMATYVADYDDCLTLLFNGDRVDYAQRKHHLNERLKLLSKGDDNTPWYRLCKAGLYMHWAFVHMRFNENLKAATHFRRSFILLKENRELYPSFEYNDIFFGIEEAAVGAIPDNYKWIASIFGMKGSMKSGAAKVRRFIDGHNMADPFYKEAVIYDVYINYFILSDKDRAWQIVNARTFTVNNDLLNSFVKANIALNFRKADEAQKVLERASNTDEYKDYPILNYEYAYALLHKLDKRSMHYFELFLKQYHGEIFVKDALMRIAFGYYVFGQYDVAERYKGKIKTAGTTLTDADKHAQRFAEHDTWPNPTLLKVQLLTDGGYYITAKSVLSGKSEDDFTSMADKLEYYFRLARVNDELGDKTEAINLYKKVVINGRDRKEQFAARSALQLGFIYEYAGDKRRAIAMYEDALSMDDHDFQNSIDQQAKAGVNRLK